MHSRGVEYRASTPRESPAPGRDLPFFGIRGSTRAPDSSLEKGDQIEPSKPSSPE